MFQELYDGIVLENDSYIIFSKKIIKKLLLYRQNNRNSPESGGLLLGYIRGNHFDVRFITKPFSKDQQSRFFFERKDSKHIERMNELFSNSKGRISYIGEWHTHPEDNPIPSSIDLNEWDGIVSQRSYPVVFLIIGTKSFYIKRKEGKSI